MIFTMKFTKGHDFVNNVGGATVLTFCMSSNHVFVKPSFVKISQRVSELLSGHDFHTEIYKGAYF